MQLFRNTCILLLTLLGVLSACSWESDQQQANGKAPARYKTFAITSEGVEQVLQLKWQNDTAVSFVLEHRQGDCNYTLSGDAVNPYITYDPESDIDEASGEPYWVDLYLYNRGSCRIAIRVAQDTSKAQLQFANCAASSSCALESVGMLRREKATN